MHDCLNLHGGFSGGFAFLRRAGSVCSQRAGGWGGFKTLCLLPSSHGLCNRCPDGPIYPTSSSCRGTEALGDVADLWPTSTTYKWDSCGKKKSYDIFCTVLMLLGLAPQRMDGVDVALQHQTSCCCKMSISVIPLHRIHQEVEATISPPEF